MRPPPVASRKHFIFTQELATGAERAEGEDDEKVATGKLTVFMMYRVCCN